MLFYCTSTTNCYLVYISVKDLPSINGVKNNVLIIRLKGNWYKWLRTAYWYKLVKNTYSYKWVKNYILCMNYNVLLLILLTYFNLNTACRGWVKLLPKSEELMTTLWF